MKILHLLSNWKWTERSEPAVDLVLAQQRRGLDVHLACDLAPAGMEVDVARRAGEKGVTGISELRLPKHLSLLTMWRDVRRLQQLIRRLAPDIVHTHMPNAHLLAAVARNRRAPFTIVRSVYSPDGPARDVRSRLLYRRATDALVVLSPCAMHRARDACGLPAERILIAEPGIDLDRFSPGRVPPDARERFGLSAEHQMLGLVSRIRAGRRIDIPVDAVAALAARFPLLRLLVVGRGRDGAMERCILGPAAQAGITDRIVLGGYCNDDQLVAAFGAMDCLVYPMPGTDKSCRTVREALACGRPVIAARTGFLPQLVEDGVTGKIVDQQATAVAAAVATLLEDDAVLTEMGRKARAAAVTRFDTATQAERVVGLYECVRSSPS